MSYTEHLSLNTPKDRSLKIWRYMNFTKFVAMLEDQALYFTHLTRLKDQFEGFLTYPASEKFRFVPDDVDPTEAKRRREVGEHNLNCTRRGRNLICVSSWHINDYESAAMWELYVKAGEGIAIQATVGGMIDSFMGTDEPIYIGTIKYVDYKEEDIPSSNILGIAMFKRKSFEHENELRAAIINKDCFKTIEFFDIKNTDNASFETRFGNNAIGKLIPVNLKTLIHSIHLAPDSPKWQYELIKKVVSKYGLDKNVLNSTLDETPLY